MEGPKRRKLRWRRSEEAGLGLRTEERGCTGLGWKWAESGSLWSEGLDGEGGGGGEHPSPRRDEVGVGTVPFTVYIYSWQRPEYR